MDGLRWILLIVGVLVIVGIVLFGRRQQSARARQDAHRDELAAAHGRREPSFGADERAAAIERDEPVDLFAHKDAGSSAGRTASTPSTEAPPSESLESTVELAKTPATASTGQQVDIEDVEGVQPPVDIPQKIVAVRMVAGDKSTFPGDQLVLSLRGIGMRHGRFGIFHRYDGNDEERVVFSAASLVEPGSFDLDNLSEQRIPGISLFMVLPGPLDGAEAFDLMMAASRTLTKSLGAELLDESGSTLSIQRERYLREEIIQYQLDSRQG